MANKTMNQFWILLAAFFAFTSAVAAETHTFEAEKAARIGGASRIADRGASGSASVIAPKEAGAGKIEVQIDGRTRATADLSTTGARQAQQTVCEIAGLTPGKHAIAIINRGSGSVAVDALIARKDL
jgi:hypothetical protein